MTGKSLKDIAVLDYLPNCNEIIIVNSQLSMEEILARDQRTTSHRVIDNISEINNQTTATSLGVRIDNNVDKSAKVCGANGVERTSNGYTASEDNCSSKTRTSSNKRIRGYSGYRGFAVTWLRLGSLLVTLLVVSIQGAPTMTSTTETPLPEGKWVNPCGLLQGDTDQPEIDGRPTEVQQLLSDAELLSQIVLQAKTAYMDAQLFRDELIVTTFKNLTGLHEDWKSQRYDWLPSKQQIPKNLSEPLDPEFLQNLDLDTALIDAYENMQKYAVALEQVVWDQVNQSLPLRPGFEKTEYKLRMVLCEIQVALAERQVKPRSDVSRSIMPVDIRNLANRGDTYRDMRDWLIFRDYMNGLEYVEQVFDHLRKRIKP